MAEVTTDPCGCPPTDYTAPTTAGVHHVILTVNDLGRSRPFYAWLMPRLGYPGANEYPGFCGWFGDAGSFWIKQADQRFTGEKFSKDRVGLCELAFRAGSRAQVDELAAALAARGATILDPPKEYAYTPGYYAVFFADPDDIKLELVHIPS